MDKCYLYYIIPIYEKPITHVSVFFAGSRFCAKYRP